jgi:endonuclease III
VATKVAVDGVRDGETLVRSLNFANKEEEYHYELDRNDTHLMLVRVLLDEKMKDQRISGQVEPFLEEAGMLRRQAEEQADAGEFEKAVSTLEESTRQVTRAIRSAGIFIPG